MRVRPERANLGVAHGVRPECANLGVAHGVRPERTNLGVAHGAWGEEVAVEYLRRDGFEIVERNPRPVANDARLEIDVVAWERRTDTMVFVEVKQHATISPYARRLRSIDRAKKNNLRRACNAWRRINKWHGSYRFDVLEIYGVPEGGRPVIDHIQNVELFTRPGRFVNW